MEVPVDVDRLETETCRGSAKLAGPPPLEILEFRGSYMRAGKSSYTLSSCCKQKSLSARCRAKRRGTDELFGAARDDGVRGVHQVEVPVDMDLLETETRRGGAKLAGPPPLEILEFRGSYMRAGKSSHTLSSCRKRKSSLALSAGCKAKRRGTDELLGAAGDDGVRGVHQVEVPVTIWP